METKLKTLNILYNENLDEYKDCRRTYELYTNIKAEAVKLLKLMNKYEKELSCLVMPKELEQFSINKDNFPPMFPKELKKYIMWQNNLTEEDLEDGN